MSVQTRRSLPFVLSVLLITATVSILDAAVAHIIREPSGDRDVTVIFSYDPKSESEILEKIGEPGHILQWQIQSSEKYVFYRPFEFSQGRFSIRPVLCLVEKYSCLSGSGREGFLYQGYLFLDPVFDLSSPFNITLAEKRIQATFAP